MMGLEVLTDSVGSPAKWSKVVALNAIGIRPVKLLDPGIVDWTLAGTVVATRVLDCQSTEEWLRRWQQCPEGELPTALVKNILMRARSDLLPGVWRSSGSYQRNTARHHPHPDPILTLSFSPSLLLVRRNGVVDHRGGSSTGVYPVALLRMINGKAVPTKAIWGG
jgi:hypothetical protein